MVDTSNNQLPLVSQDIKNNQNLFVCEMFGNWGRTKLINHKPFMPGYLVQDVFTVRKFENAGECLTYYGISTGGCE